MAGYAYGRSTPLPLSLKKSVQVAFYYLMLECIMVADSVSEGRAVTSTITIRLE